MSETPPSDVLGSLPRSRPHRRSDKRAARPAAGVPTDTGHGATPADEPVVTAADATPATPRKRATVAKKPAAKATAKAKAAPRAKSQPTAATPPARPRIVTPTAGQPAPARRPAPSRRRSLDQPAQPLGTPEGPRSRRPVPPSPAEMLGTAVQAAAEVAEIGLTASARALRAAVAKLPRP